MMVNHRPVSGILFYGQTDGDMSQGGGRRESRCVKGLHA